jgi:poly(3-hydroxyalkanoate) synthetase
MYLEHMILHTLRTNIYLINWIKKKKCAKKIEWKLYTLAGRGNELMTCMNSCKKRWGIDFGNGTI